jgi:capsular polysaccharide biosynthesis protein
MTLEQFFAIILKRLWLIILVTILTGTAAGLFSWLALSDVYQASTTIIVSSQTVDASQAQLTYNDYSLNIKLVNSYSVICKTNRVLDQVISELGLPLTSKTLSDKITVSAAKDTEIIHIAVNDSNPYRAQAIANSLTTVFQREVKSIMKMDNVQIIDEAPLPLTPVSPNRPRNLVLGILVGLMLGLGIAVLIEYLDRSIKTEEQITELIGIPVLASVPRIAREQK